MIPQTLSADLVGIEFEPRKVSWTSKDVMLYALGVGSKPGTELDFLYEHHGPKVLPTYAVIPGMRAMGNIGKAVELDVARLLHGEQGIEIHRPLPAQAELIMTSHISEVWDKGKAAVIGVEADFSDDEGPVFSTRSTLFYLGAGGFGGEPGPSTRTLNLPPGRDPDLTVSYLTQEEQGALYRLSGDRVALHIDPAFAEKAGYEKPFMHGLCTFGFVGRAALQGLCDGDPARFVSFSGRFSERVEFGDEIQTRIWHTEPGEAVLQAVTQDGKVVLSQAKATFKV
ncbi:MAG: 3-alpha,7-alpha,12-alpha-trihydroxy-5-beta-cholest-24-enoyl-CoA hydratase [Gammaproteobacteria bacterium]|nr:MAG: 3-alpha,7-alpha,12-alpha-trihydroxy-5-beta-cholest-24-enoyl-CoA hydratase [Gammaproteobacteria bacterium]